MYEIKYKKRIAENIFYYKIFAPHIVKNYQPGQFLILIPYEKGERIPLTICEVDNENITIIFQVVGKTTKFLSRLDVGDKIFGVLGPLGNKAEIENFGTVVCIGGGVGTAVVYPEIKALYNAGNKVYTIIGARTKNLIILKNEIEQYSHKLFITTDDGTYGEKGVVTQPLEKILSTQKVDRVIAIGPLIMMKFVSLLTKKYNVKTIVSLNPIMVDGTGMCGACRVKVGNSTKFACVDGPEFDAHLVDFDNLISRNKQYEDLERLAANYE